jgi:hypothetical protein
MGSFAGGIIDVENLDNAVILAQKKALLDERQKVIDYENERNKVLAQTLSDYRNGIANASFPDGQYYVVYDFNTTNAHPANLVYSGIGDDVPKSRLFKKGEVVNVITQNFGVEDGNKKVIYSDGVFWYSDKNKLSQVKPLEPVGIVNGVDTGAKVGNDSSNEIRRRNENKTKIMVVGALILGILLSND